MRLTPALFSSLTLLKNCLMISLLCTLLRVAVHASFDVSLLDVILNAGCAYLHLNLIQFLFECVMIKIFEIVIRLFTYLLKSFRINLVASDSMAPTLIRGDMMIVDVRVDEQSIRLDDIVTFLLDGVTFVKRVKGLSVSSPFFYLFQPLFIRL